MRRLLIALVACPLALTLSPPPAEAQEWTDGECTVSIWWPYSREPGDCLTDSERRAGGTGTFRDPDGAYMRSPIAAQALRVLEGCDPAAAPEPVVSSISERVIVRGTEAQSVTITGTNFRCNTQVYFNAVPIPTRVVSATQIDALIPAELAQRPGDYPMIVRNRAPTAVASLAGPAAPVAGAAGGDGGGGGLFGLFGSDDEQEGPRQITNERGCTTHLLWPYVRRPGDCLTDAEREAGMVGVYGGSRMASDPAPEPVPGAPTVAPLPAASGSGGIFGLFDGDPQFGGGGLLDDNLLPQGQGGQ
jgi:hypothetical protein